MIDSCGFGKIVIKGKRYDSDVIICGDHVDDRWWRKKGHELHVDDVAKIAEWEPEVLIIGTGHSGFMKVLPETKGYLESMGITVISEQTERACKIYNELRESRKVAAALHLTC